MIRKDEMHRFVKAVQSVEAAEPLPDDIAEKIAQAVADEVEKGSRYAKLARLVKEYGFSEQDLWNVTDKRLKRLLWDFAETRYGS